MDLSLLVGTLDLQGRKMHFTQACDWKNVPYLHSINGLLLLKVIGSRKDQASTPAVHAVNNEFIMTTMGLTPLTSKFKATLKELIY